ncbi:hypothetical protein LUX34_02440 [Streptomyces werraensis]|nr:hypothetical protein [Streptomyces werraensis]
MAQEVRRERPAESVGLLGVYRLLAQGGGDDGVAGEGDRALEPSSQGRQHRDLAVDRREAAVGGCQEVREERMRCAHGCHLSVEEVQRVIVGQPVPAPLSK